MSRDPRMLTVFARVELLSVESYAKKSKATTLDTVSCATGKERRVSYVVISFYYYNNNVNRTRQLSS